MKALMNVLLFCFFTGTSVALFIKQRMLSQENIWHHKNSEKRFNHFSAGNREYTHAIEKNSDR